MGKKGRLEKALLRRGKTDRRNGEMQTSGPERAAVRR
jgi:hypothetical protein